MESNMQWSGAKLFKSGAKFEGDPLCVLGHRVVVVRRHADHPGGGEFGKGLQVLQFQLRRNVAEPLKVIGLTM